TGPRFGPRESICYDARTDRLMRLASVWLNPLQDRVVCRLLLGARQHALLVNHAGESGSGGLSWSGGAASTLCTSCTVGKRQRRPRQTAERWGLTWAWCIWRRIARVRSSAARR